MKRKRSLVAAACELLTVFLVALLAFAWGMRVAQAERGYDAIGGECVFLLIPAVYYIVKRMAVDWIADMKN